MVLTAAVSTILCLALRTAGFKLRAKLDSGSASDATKSLQVNQFGVKHMLSWATGIVPILLVARGLDGMFLSTLGKGGLSAAVALAVCIAAIDLTALWLVLAEGRYRIRVVAFVVVPFAVVIGLTFCSLYFESRYGRWRGPPVADLFVEMRTLWTSWIWLMAGLTAALLFYLRAIGYRIMRSSRHNQPAA
jgi:hypothetical protein